MHTERKRILTDAEAARLLKMPRSRLARLAKTGVVPSVHLPDGEPRFIAADLWEWVQRHKQEASQ